MNTFKTGAVYSHGWIGDSKAPRVEYRVIKRTAKNVWLQSRDGNVTRKAVKSVDGNEICFPLGQYSMAPTLRAA